MESDKLNTQTNKGSKQVILETIMKTQALQPLADGPLMKLLRHSLGEGQPEKGASKVKSVL